MRSTAGTLDSHAAAVAHFCQQSFPSSSSSNKAPVLLAHSLGGLTAQRLISKMFYGELDGSLLAGAVFMCSSPPTGNGPMVGRFLRTRPLASVKLTYNLVAKACLKSIPACKDTFFSPNTPDELITRYLPKLATSSRQPVLDLRTYASVLPFPAPSATNKSASFPTLVLGTEHDALVDKEGVEECARWCGSGSALMLNGLGHDIMLDAGWEHAADAVLQWLDAH
eukprot:jgi/Chlat1/5301/Chrsp35S08977